jgi:hypothetical protein
VTCNNREVSGRGPSGCLTSPQAFTPWSTTQADILYLLLLGWRIDWLWVLCGFWLRFRRGEVQIALRSVPGIGPILGMTIAMETGDATRFASAGELPVDG